MKISCLIQFTVPLSPLVSHPKDEEEEDESMKGCEATINNRSFIRQKGKEVYTFIIDENLRLFYPSLEVV